MGEVDDPVEEGAEERGAQEVEGKLGEEFAEEVGAELVGARGLLLHDDGLFDREGVDDRLHVA